jgi:hypothetical protein
METLKNKKIKTRLMGWTKRIGIVRRWRRSLVTFPISLWAYSRRAHTSFEYDLVCLSEEKKRFIWASPLID